MNSNQYTALIALAFILLAASINCYKIYKRKVEPTLSTWVIFLIGTAMSFASYFINSHHDWTAGALNGADVIGDIMVIFTITFFGLTKWNLKSFEKYYLSGLILIGLFWLITSNSYNSNLLIQVMLTLGYFPTAHTIIKFKRNTESLSVWGLILFASVISLYPTFNAWQSNGNILGLVYSARSVFLLTIMLILMLAYHPKEANQLDPI